MRRLFVTAGAVCGVMLLSAQADAQTRGGQIQGFGGTTFGTTAAAPTFGAGVAVPLGDHLQLVAEGGRLTDIKAPLLDRALDFGDIDVAMSAWYAEGGLRFTGSRHSTVRPYVEATAGVARLNPTVGLNGWMGALTNAGLSFLGTTEPMVGGGGGVVVQGGPVTVDLGYRYKKILADGGLASAFALGTNGFDVHQARIGVGVRF